MLVASDEFECQQKCLGNNSCKSFDVYPGADIAKRICEPNNKTQQMKPRDFKKKKGSNYYGSVKVSVFTTITKESFENWNALSTIINVRF